MIDVRALKKSEYTFSEVAALFKLDPYIVRSDFRRRKFPVTYRKMKVTSTFMRGLRYKPKTKIAIVSKKTLLIYRQYLLVKRCLSR